MNEHRKIKKSLVIVASLLFGLSCFESAAHAQRQIFAANYNTNAITVYPRTADGNVPPANTFFTQAGNCSTTGDCPHGLALLDSARELFVVGNISASVTVYDSLTGGQKRKIQGNSTQLCRPIAVAVDKKNEEIFVTNDFCNSVTVYSLNANGDAPPLRVIKGDSTSDITGLSKPAGVAVDVTNNELFIVNYGLTFPSITTFDRTASGNVRPKRTIAGPQTGLNLPQGFALDWIHGEIIVASSAFSSPDAGAIQAFHLTDVGDVAPIRTLTGPHTKLCNPMDVTFDAVNDQVIVPNLAYGGGTCAPSVTTYARLANGDSAPLRTVTGALTNLTNPIATAVTTITRGFLAGTGWIDSRAGAYRPDPTLTGRAHFNFHATARSAARAPSGEAEFTFRSAGFEFKSTAYESLVVDGAKAQLKGVGTINGKGTYQFLISLIDGRLPGGNRVDKFRLRITDGSTLVYDNAYPGEGEQAIRGLIMVLKNPPNDFGERRSDDD